jgi:hypothetical protein
MVRAKASAVGERGSWFATVNGERLPCVHMHWWIKGSKKFADPGYLAGEGQWPALVSAIEQFGKVIVTKDDPLSVPENKSGLGFKRAGYLAVFTVANIEADEASLRFDLTGRVCDLQG